MKKISSKTLDNSIKALMNISKAITSEKYLEDILKLIIMVAANVTSIEICSIWLIDESERPSRIALKATQAIDADYVKHRSLTLDEGVVGFVATHKQTLIVEDVLKEPRFKEKEVAEKLGLVSMLGIPMQVKKDKAIGVLNCFTTKPYKFSEKEINLMTTVANQGAIVILNTELMVRSSVIHEELSTSKLIQEARLTLMRQRNMSGDEAHRWIRKCSMDSLRSIRQVAEAILLSHD